MIDKIALPKWCDKTVMEKILFTTQIILSAFAILLAVLHIFCILEALDIFLLLLSGVMLIMFLQYKKYSKFNAYSYLGAAIFIFLCWLYEFKM